MAESSVGFSDLKYVLWKPTLQVNLLRAVVAGILWTMIMTIIIISDPRYHGALQPYQHLIMLVGFPIAYLVVYMPMGLICGGLARAGVPFVAWITFFVALTILPADPFVWMLSKAKPSLVPMAGFGFFNRALVLFVMDEDWVRRNAA